MRDLSIHIKELLTKHDCVILKNIGGLVAKYRGAEIKRKEGEISPPDKNIGFNSQLKFDDGLLAAKISEEEGISFSEAQKAVEEYTNSIISKLNSEKSATINEVGILFYDTNKSICFEPNKNTRYLTDSFGFENIKLQPLKKTETKDRKTENNKKDNISVAPKRNKALKVIFIILLILVVIGGGTFAKLGYLDNYVPGLSSSLSFLKDKEDKVLENNDEKKKIKEITTKKDTTTSLVENTKKSTSDNRKKPDEKESIEKAIEKKTDKKTALLYKEKKRKLDNKPTYILIAGSFATQKNAKVLFDQLRAEGFDSEILTSENGRIRVTFGSYKNRDLALKELNKIRQIKTDSSVWMLTLK